VIEGGGEFIEAGQVLPAGRYQFVYSNVKDVGSLSQIRLRNTRPHSIGIQGGLRRRENKRRAEYSARLVMCPGGIARAPPV
jgi:hypothetical protein